MGFFFKAQKEEAANADKTERRTRKGNSRKAGTTKTKGAGRTEKVNLLSYLVIGESCLHYI